jgi:hypothetical protein
LALANTASIVELLLSATVYLVLDDFGSLGRAVV